MLCRSRPRLTRCCAIAPMRACARDRLANNVTFQRIAWHGTEAAKKTAKEGAEALKKSDAYRTAQYKAMEGVQQLKQSPAFKEFEASGVMRTAKQVKDKLVAELRQTRLK